MVRWWLVRLVLFVTILAVVGTGEAEERIVFSAYPTNSSGYEIFVMNTDGTRQVNLTKHPGWDQFPSWSPDGRKIAFVSDRDGNEEIYVMNADGSDQTNVTNEQGRDIDPSWSPDGKRILFASGRSGGRAEIYTINPDGKGLVRLTDNTEEEYSPSWSPEGTKIIFVAKTEVDGYEFAQIFTMDSNGTNRSRLIPTSMHQGEPSWSPDGTKVLFTAHTNEDQNSRLYVANSDGSNMFEIVPQPPLFVSAPAWSSDGTKIVFIGGHAGDLGNVYVMGIDGSSPTNLSNHPWTDQTPQWWSSERIVHTVVLPASWGSIKSTGK